MSCIHWLIQIHCRFSFSDELLQYVESDSCSRETPIPDEQDDIMNLSQEVNLKS